MDEVQKPSNWVLHTIVRPLHDMQHDSTVSNVAESAHDRRSGPTPAHNPNSTPAWLSVAWEALGTLPVPLQRVQTLYPFSFHCIQKDSSNYI
jgi:hypothetical protein